MPYQEDSGYYSCRMAEEVEPGEQATHPSAATIHYELAYRYGILAAQSVAGALPAMPIEDEPVHAAPQIILGALVAA